LCVKLLTVQVFFAQLERIYPLKSFMFFLARSVHILIDMKILHYILVFVLIIAFGALYAGATGCSVGLAPVATTPDDGGGDDDGGGGGGDDGGGGGGGDDGGGTVSAAKSLGVTATPSTGEVVLDWAADPDADSYDVYILPIDPADADEITAITEIHDADSGEFDLEELFSDIDMTVENVVDVTYTHTGATNGQAYCYVVTPHQDASELTIDVDTLNTPDCAMPLEKPAIATAPDSTYVGLNWSDVGADGYRVRRGDELCANFAQVEETIDLTTDDVGRTNGVTYCYSVDPYWDNYLGERKVVTGDEATATPEITLAQPNPNVFGDGELNVPGVLLDKGAFGGGAAYDDERVYIGDGGSGLVYAYDRDGALVGSFQPGGELRPNAANVMAFDGDDYIVSIGVADRVCKWDVATLNPVAAFDGDGCTADTALNMHAVKVLSDGNYAVVGTDSLGATADGFMNIYDADDGSLLHSATWDTGDDDYLFDFVEIDDGWIAVGYSDDGAQQAYAVKFGYNDAMALEFKADYDITGAGNQATRVDRHVSGGLIALVDNQNLARIDESLMIEPTVVALTTGVGVVPAAYDIYTDVQDRLMVAGAVEILGGDVKADLWLMEWTGVTYSIDTEAVSMKAGDSAYRSISPTKLESIVVTGWDVTGNETYAIEY
jgi:hypothetical protein